MKKLALTLVGLLGICGMTVGQTYSRQEKNKSVESVATWLERRDGGKTLSDRFKDVRVGELSRLYGLVRDGMEETVSVGAGASQAGAVKNGAVGLPFICRFDYAKELEEKWDVYDNDGDNQTWVYKTSEAVSFPTCDGNDESGFAYCAYNKEKSPENWLMTKAPLSMSAGKAYVAFYHGIMGGYPERLKVYYGKTSTPNMKDMTLIGEVRDDSVGWKFKVLPFEIKEAGDYYFAFVHCSEPDQFYLLLDNVEINEGTFTGTPNLTVLRPVLPPSACGLGNAEKVGVQIKNNGTAAIEKMTLTYTVGGGAPVEKTVTEKLDVGKSRIEYFGQAADFSEEGKRYEVTVTGTVLESDGKAEAKTDDNVAEGSVRHFTPVESLPLSIDMSRPEDLAQLGYDAAYWEYWEKDGMICAVEQEPLITRCMQLDANRIYRFNFEYSAGIDIGFFESMVIADDFAIVYGLVGTPVSEWTVLKSYADVYTQEVFVYEEIKFKNEKAGVYAFAVVPKEGVWGSYNGTLCLSRIVVEKMQGKDVKMSAMQTSLGLRTPVRHAVAARFGMEVVNRGGEDVQDVRVTVRQGETEVGVSEAVSIKANDTAYCTVSGGLARPSVGSEVALTFEAVMPQEDEYPNDNKREWTFTATDGLYAFDADIEEYEDGIGTREFIFGPVFTLAETDTLAAVTFGWFDLSDYVPAPFAVGVEVYPVDDAGKVSHCILSHEFERQVEGGLQTVALPGRVLSAGRYFIAVRQLSSVNIAIGYDGNPEGLFYGMADDEDDIDAIGSHGCIAIRAVFGHSDNIVAKDIEMLDIVKPRAKGAFAANEPVEALYRNNGKDTVEVTFKCIVDGNELGTKVVKVPAYDMGTVVFTADLSKVGIHAVRVEAEAEGDENSANNMVQKSAECIVWDPYVMDFELCDDFTVTDVMPWTSVDRDRAKTWGMYGIDWPHSGEAMGFMAFNPSETEPAVDDVLKPHGGERMGVAFVSVDRQNDDWLISPKLKMPETGAGLSFYTRAFLVGEENYVERYEVWVSETAADPEAFVRLGETYETSENEWRETTVDLAAYNGKEVYLAIRCVSEDQYIFMIDDIRVNKPVANEKTLDLSNRVKSYPNPVSGLWTVTAFGLTINRVEIFNMQGGIVYRSADNLSAEAWRLNMDGLTPGLYVARVYTDAGVQLLKVTVQ